jgi:hypothetical protein
MFLIVSVVVALCRLLNHRLVDNDFIIVNMIGGDIVRFVLRLYRFFAFASFLPDACLAR